MAQPFSPQIIVAGLFDQQHLGDHKIVQGLKPAVPIVVLDANVWFPTPPTDPYVLENWYNLIKGYQAAGIKVLGYVPTDGGTGTPGLGSEPVFVNDVPIYPTDPNYPGKQYSPSQIKNWVSLWFNLFKPTSPTGATPAHPDGIFFDEGPDPWRFNGKTVAGNPLDKSIYAFYVDLRNYVRTNHGQSQTVMLNAAGYTEPVDWVLGTGPMLSGPAADIALLWERPWQDYSGVGSSPNYPSNPPAWWTNPANKEKIMHTVYDCAESNVCQAVSLARQRNAGYIYTYDGSSTSYNHLPPYWQKKVAVVALRDDYDVYARDWTDSRYSYDQGVEPSAHEFWTTSDVWNRLSGATPVGGFFNSDDQAVSESPMLDAQGNNTNYAFARVHRKPCNTQQQTVEAYFLWADFGAGTNFKYVNGSAAASRTTLTFNPGDWRLTTPGLQWTLPASVSDHICLAVQLNTTNDPYKGTGLDGQSTSTSGNLITGDNNKAQRNLSVVNLSTPMPLPIAGYGIVHNGDLFERDVELVYEDGAAGDFRESLQGASIEVIDERGNRETWAYEPGGRITLGAMQPVEDRWIGLVFPAQEGERRLLPPPVTFKELAKDEVVNGFTIAAGLSDLRTVIRTNLNLHALRFRRLAAAFEIEGAEDEYETAFEQLMREREMFGEEYVEFLRQRSDAMYEVASRLIRLHEAGDPFEVETAAQSLVDVVWRNDDPDLATASHIRLLNKLDACSTMLQKARGDAADILQTVKWQRELFTTSPGLKKLPPSRRIVEESGAFITAYQKGEIGDDAYPGLMRNLIDILHRASAPKGAKLRPAEDTADMERSLGSPTRLQRAHREYLLRLQRLDRRVVRA